jgi:serine phosphatase RsbU (regulator of sigma subunit)
MGFRFTIGRKIGTGFGVLILLIVIINFQTLLTLDSSRVINEEIIHLHSPSVDKLQELKILVLRSKMLITNWFNIQSSTDHPEKANLIALTEKEYPEIKEEIIKISERWNEAERERINKIFDDITRLFEYHEIIKTQLVTFENYDDPSIKFLVSPMIEENGEIDVQTDLVLENLDKLIKVQRKNSEEGANNMINSFDALEFVVKNLGFVLILGGVLIAFFTVRTIVKPVQELKRLLLLMGKGIIPEYKMKPRNDEIGEMSAALNHLVEGFKRTTYFAKQVGSGNFASEYEPLSKEDTLGHSLIAMRKDLYELTSNLEQKVSERTAEVEAQKKEIEVLLKHITDSIVYAKRIQEAILPPQSYVKSLLPNSFVLFKPKDIVSGDFYWMEEKDDTVIFAAVDCTGHGVPGAFMTIIGYNGLNHAFNESKETSPASILNSLNEVISTTLRQDKGSNIKDGMDAAMCMINPKTNELQFAGAFNPLFLIREGVVQEIKGNKLPIGAFIGEERQKFTNHKFQLEKGDTIYIFSDGYADQFGGPKGKKFMYKQFRDLLLEINGKSMDDQKKILNETIESWRGEHEQVDDILVIGLKI